MTDADLLQKYGSSPVWIEHPAVGNSIWVFSVDNGARHVAVRFGSDDKVARAVELSIGRRQPKASAGMCTDLTPQMRGMTDADLLQKYGSSPAWIEYPATRHSIWVFSLDDGARHVAVTFGPDGKVMRATEIR